MFHLTRPAWCRAVGTAAVLTGTVTEWHPFERRGRIVENETGKEYVIADTRAFETVLPTLLRALKGATVKFEAQSTAMSDRVITRKRLDLITAESYKQRPPRDFLLTFEEHQKRRSTQASDASSSASTQGAGGSKGGTDSSALYATNIVVDINSIPSDQLVRIHGPLVDTIDDVLPPTTNLKDMRSSRVLDAETLEFLKLRSELGSSDKAREEMQRRDEQRARTAVQREVVVSGARGLVMAWSGLHRSGVIVEGLLEVPKDAAVDLASSAAAQQQNMCIVRNVHAFESALPTSNRLLHRLVTFDKVRYSTQPEKFFAEHIKVEGDVEFDDSAPSIEETVKAKAAERATEKRAKQLGTHFFEEEEHRVGYPADRPLPADPLFGVVTRWSGGQGVVESGEGHMFYVQSGSDFNQLVDQDSHTIRGAVVSFRVDPDTRRFARSIDILSTSTTSLEEMKPMLSRVPGSRAQQRRQQQQAASKRGEGAVPSEVGGLTERNEVTGQTVVRGLDAEPVNVPWQAGLLVAWSPVEGQGIIQGDDDVRYVLRDAADNVIAYKQRRDLLKNGRKVKFTAFGTTGKLACNVVPLDTEADEAELRESELRADEPKLSIDGNMNEAIASPMSTSYWISRMDKAGYDVSEVKQLQNRALTLDEDDGDDGTEGGKFMDSDDLIKSDSWFSDPKKNVRFPNSDITAGHLAMLGPASMMNMALKAKDPKKLEKMTAKYQARLTEDQKEFAWKQAKEMAPKYESIIKKARERNEEPRFYFV